MNTYLKFEAGAFEALLSHLLPRNDSREQAAFLYALVNTTADGMSFDVVEMDKMQPRDFVIQHEFHLELGGAARQRVIKRAHDLRASLIEVHSHRGGLSAEFSPSDLSGLRETVPNIRWRLKKRPYVAIVVAQDGLDALVWIDSADEALPLTGLVAGNHVHRPTNISLRYW